MSFMSSRFAWSPIVLGLITYGILSAPALAQGMSLLHFGSHIFAIPGIREYSPNTAADHPQEVRKDVLWPSLQPAGHVLAADPATLMAKRDEVLTLLLSYQSPTYAGRQAADNFLRIHSEPMATPSIPGYDVRGVGLDQDIFLAREQGQEPEAILCNRPSRRLGDVGRPTCTVIDAVDVMEYPVKPDGRWPLTLTYTFAKVHLPEIARIDTSLRNLIHSWEIGRPIK